MPGRCGGSGAPATWPASPCGFPTPPSRSASVSSSSSRFAALSARCDDCRNARPSHDLRPRGGADRAAAARLPDFPGLVDRGHRRAGVLHARAARGAATDPVRVGQRIGAAGHSVLHLRRRADGSRQRRAALGRFRAGRVGSIRGSLGVTAVGTSAIFGAISGASAATVATIGKVMVPAMRHAGYPETFIAGLITAVGAIDVIIPPSIPMIVYGAAAEESVARLYAAG